MASLKNLLSGLLSFIFFLGVRGWVPRRDPYYHYAPYYMVHPKTSPACRGSNPCYNIVLTYVSDGSLTFDKVFNEQKLIDHFAIAGYDRAATIEEARIAARHFRRMYGYDFTHLRDEDFLRGVSYGKDGTSFRPYVLSTEARYRFYMGANGDEAQVFNRPISDAGWLLEVSRDTQSRGTYRGVIPRTAFALYGSYIIKPCDERGCHNVLNPRNPTEVIKINFWSVDYMNVVKDPITFNGLHCHVEHPVWGRGRARGFLPRRIEGTEITDGRNVLTFPAIR